MPADYSRIHRLLKILNLIQFSRGWTPRRLAVECETTERTIYRDLKMLQGAGVPYFYDHQQRSYGVQNDFFMPPVQLTLDESLALTALAEHVGGREQVPFTRPASRAISKVRGVLPKGIRNELEKIENHIAIQLAATSAPEASQDVYDTVRTALATRRSLRCTYDSVGSGKKKPVAFLFKPYVLFFGQRAWYVIGHHCGHDEVRCLKLNRFTQIEPTDHPYTVPRGFSLEKHIGAAWRMIRGKTRYSVELAFDAEFAETVADTHWHASQQIEWQSDGSIVFKCRVDGLDEIVWWVLGYGPHCVVRRPTELVQRVKSLATAVTGIYSQP